MLASNRMWALWLALATTAIVPAVCSGFVIGFEGITSNNSTAVATGEAQLWMDVTTPQADQVLFTFGNTGLGTCAIGQVYFELGGLGSIGELLESSGVDFSQNSKLQGLPGGNTLTPGFVTAFNLEAKNPAPRNGVNNGPAIDGETLGVLFSLADGYSYEDIVSQLNSGQLRIGLHVQDFQGGWSEAFVNHMVPEPAAAALMAVGMVLVRVTRRRVTA